MSDTGVAGWPGALTVDSVRTHINETAIGGSDPARPGDQPTASTEAAVTVPKPRNSERPGYRDMNIDLKRRWLRVRDELANAELSGDAEAVTRCRSDLDRIATEFFVKNKGLAVSGAKPFLAPGDQHGDDYINAASLGLWEAFHRWDPEQGVTFGTFSRQYIKGRIVRAVRTSEYGHISQTDFNRRKDVRDTLTRLTDELDRTPTREEVASATGLTVDAVNRSLAPAATSLDLPVGDGTATLGDLVEDDNAPTSFGVDLSDQSQVDRLLDELNELELWVVNARGELLGTPAQSLVEIADEIGVGREIVRRSETKARARLLFTSMSIDLGRLPTWDEFAARLGITESVTSGSRKLTPADQARAMVQPTWNDLHSRWGRASLVLADARRRSDWNATDRRRARLDRLGEEVMVTGSKLIAEHATLFVNEQGDVLGADRAALELWDAFRSWDPVNSVQFPAWYRRACNAKFRRHQSATKTNEIDPVEIESAAANLWARVRRNGMDLLEVR